MRRHAITILIAAALFSGLPLLGGCGGSSGGGGGGPEPISLGSVTAYYSSNGVDWNDYVKNDGGTVYTASDAAATGAETGGYTANIHGGEMRAVAVYGLSSCDGVTASDALGAFDWVCNDGTDPVTVVSTGLADGKGLSDLLYFSGPGWLENQVTVYRDGAPCGATWPAVWWNNPLSVNNDGGTLGSAGTIYVVQQGATLSTNFLINADRVGLVIEPGYTLEGAGKSGGALVRAAGRSFLWFEGRGKSHGISSEKYGLYFGGEDAFSLPCVTFSRIHNAVANNFQYGFYLVNASSNTLTNVTATGNDNTGVYLGGSSNNTLTDVTATGNGDKGVVLDAIPHFILIKSWRNTLTDVTATGNEGHGVYLSDTDFNTLTDVTATNNGTGIYLNHSSINTLTNVTATGNRVDGLYLHGDPFKGGGRGSGSGINTLTDVMATGNGVNGVHLDSYGENTLTDVMAAGNKDGVFLSSSSNNTLTDLMAAGNEYHGVFLKGESKNNTLIGVTATGNTYNGVYLYNLSNNNFLANIVSANNGNHGIYIYDSTGNSVRGAIEVNNFYDGLALTDADASQVTDLVSAYNGRAGVYLNSTTTGHAFNGVLAVGGNTYEVFNGSSQSPATSLNSQAVTGISLAGTFEGAVTTDDTVNLSDSNGFALFGSITDWASFENPYRAWGKDGPALSSAVRGVPVGSDPCRIWDWSLDRDDTVALDALSVPGPSDTLTHLYDDGAHTQFLAYAVEFVGDGVGNDDGLCEGGEDCLATPNIGSYQGHGELVLENSFLFQSQNVNIYAYSVNGY